MVMATGTIIAVSADAEGEPVMQIQVTTPCSGLSSAVPRSAIASQSFDCPVLDLADFGGKVSVQGADGEAKEKSDAATAGSVITVKGANTIAAIIRSPDDTFWPFLSNGSFARMNRINSLNRSASVDRNVNSDQDVVVHPGQLVRRAVV